MTNQCGSSKVFWEDYTMLVDTSETPLGETYQLQILLHLISDDSRLFSAPFFDMPYAPVKLLKDVAKIYNNPNSGSLMLRQLKVDSSEEDKDWMMLRFWLEIILIIPSSVSHTIFSTVNNQVGIIYDSEPPVASTARTDDRRSTITPIRS